MEDWWLVHACAAQPLPQLPKGDIKVSFRLRWPISSHHKTNQLLTSSHVFHLVHLHRSCHAIPKAKQQLDLSPEIQRVEPVHQSIHCSLGQQMNANGFCIHGENGHQEVSSDWFFLKVFTQQLRKSGRLTQTNNATQPTPLNHFKLMTVCYCYLPNSNDQLHTDLGTSKNTIFASLPQNIQIPSAGCSF